MMKRQSVSTKLRGATCQKTAIFKFHEPVTGSAELCLVGLYHPLSLPIARAASLIALMMEAVLTSETSVNSYQYTQRCNPEDSHRHPFLII
jgi:hypothetical protein